MYFMFTKKSEKKKYVTNGNVIGTSERSGKAKFQVNIIYSPYKLNELTWNRQILDTINPTLQLFMTRLGKM